MKDYVIILNRAYSSSCLGYNCEPSWNMKEHARCPNNLKVTKGGTWAWSSSC